MNKEEIISLFTDDVEVRKEAIRNYIMDTNNTYEDRYDVWKNTPDHLMSKDSWIFHPTGYEEKYGEVSWFDDFYCERYSDVDLRDCIGYKIDDTDWPEEKCKAFITECMDKGFHGFYCDW